VDDFVLQLAYQLSGEQYLNSLTFLQNAVDWSLEDEDLLSIRSRGTAVRVLESMPDGSQAAWESANYLIALVLLVGFYLFWQYKKRNEKPLELLPAASVLEENSRQTGESK
jgi:ABC-2 type transport system permease protein